MLLQLEIKNFAIIEHSLINFEEKFNVITGETGSGKSILFDALSCVIGERSSKEIVRKGEEKAEIKIVFLKTSKIEKKLSKKGIKIEDDVVIIERQISKSGRSIAKINGRIETVQTIKEVCEELIEISGQKEHLNLMNEQKYLQIIDGLLNTENKEKLTKYKEKYLKLREINQQLDNLSNAHREQEQLMDLYRFQKKEIEKANLKLNEDEELEEEKRVLSSFEKINQKVQKTLNALESVDHLYDAKNNLSEAVDFDKTLHELSERLEKAYYEIEDVRSEIQNYIDDFEYDEEKLNHIIYRLETINSLKRKYGDSITEIINHYEEVEKKIDEVENKDEHISSLLKEKTIIEKEMSEVSTIIHEKRKEIALDLQEKVNKQINELCMENAKLVFQLELTDEFNSNGKTKLQVLFTANKGEDLKPLSKVASGGELSRVLLALKMATNENQGIEVVVFDEVDEGIGGEVGRVIGQKLNELGEKVQVITISHLPQVAAKANTHFLIEKRTDEQRTYSTLSKLKEEERKEEIARMIFGHEKNEITLKQAEEMLKK